MVCEQKRIYQDSANRRCQLVNIADKVIGLLALGAVLYYVFNNSGTTSSIVSSLAGGFGTVEGALQGKSSTSPNINIAG